MRQGRRPLRRPPAGLRRRHRPLGRLEADVARGLAPRHDWGPSTARPTSPAPWPGWASATTRRSWVNPRPTAAPNPGSAPSRSSACGSSCTTPWRSSARPWPASSSAPTAPGSSNGTATRLRRSLSASSTGSSGMTKLARHLSKKPGAVHHPQNRQVRASSVPHRRRSPRSGAALGPRTLPRQLSTAAPWSSLPASRWRQSARRSGPFRPSPGQATGVRRGRLVPSAPPMAPMARLRSGIHTSSMIEPPRSSPTA